MSQANIDELLAKRSATPVFDPVTGESSFTYQLEVSDATTTCTQTREVHFVDAQGAQLRVDLARTQLLGSVSLWALGFDSPATWQVLAPLARVPGSTSTVAAP